ncbi:hypothetical protein FQA39_LY17616 [Lamprigera yunnana]|nr:hypothetical protein FQA39_LY17616 [Lamprigera yunnana]
MDFSSDDSYDHPNFHPSDTDESDPDTIVHSEDDSDNELFLRSPSEFHEVNMLSESELFRVIIAVAASTKEEKKKKGRKWAKQRFSDREKYTHKKLLNEPRLIEPNDFHNFLPMGGELFDELLALITPEIGKIMRDAIPAS